MKQFQYKLIFIFFMIAFYGQFSCKPQSNRYKNPNGYDFSSPEKFNMPESLLEISGITFNQLNGDTVYSVQDEDGSLFRQKWGDKHQQHVRFSDKGDFEDLAILKGTVITLKSNGSLFFFPLVEQSKKKTENVKEWDKILPKGEYESLYADEDNNTIYVLTKTSNVDRQSGQATGYILNYKQDTGELILSGNFKIDSKQIEGFGFTIKGSLKTSAMSRKPRSKEWYILSSVNKFLLTTDSLWNVTGVYRLNSYYFNQPEGLAFDKDLNLYISNEGDELSSGNILKFKYRPLK